MRVETQRASEVLMGGIVVGVVEALMISGRGGVMTLLGTVFIAAITWAMLALRTIAADGAPEPEIDDGVMCMAAMAWSMVVLPVRVGNFVDVPTIDDFTWVYFPASVVVVFAMLLAQKVWAVRSVRSLVARGLATTGMTVLAMAALIFFVTRGEGAAAMAIRGLISAVVTVGIAVALREKKQPA